MNPLAIFPSLHVLVIEDDPDMRALLCRTLVRHKVGSVSEAATAEDALRLLEAPTGEINFVLSDWNLPGVSGFDLCRMLKSEKPIMPVLMITGRDDARSILLARSAGIDGYLVKPITPSELLQKIAFVANQRWASRGALSSDDGAALGFK